MGSHGKLLWHIQMKHKKTFWWTNAISLEQAHNDFLYKTEDFCSYNRRDKIYRGYHSDSVSIAKAYKKDKLLPRDCKTSQTDDKHSAGRENKSNNLQNVFTIWHLGIAQNWNGI